MAHLIKMDSITFLNAMMENKENPDKFTFLVISRDIKTNGENKNVYPLDKLIPTPQVITTFIDEGYSDKYIKKYIKYLQTHNCRMLLATIAKMVVGEGTNVVLICSEHETQYKYIDLIAKYLKKVYGIKACSYKKFVKDPDKYDNGDLSEKKIDKIIKHEMAEIGVEYKAEKKSKKKDKKNKLNRFTLIQKVSVFFIAAGVPKRPLK